MNNVAATLNATQETAIQSARAMLATSLEQLAAFRAEAKEESVVMCYRDAAVMTIEFRDSAYRIKATNAPVVWAEPGARNVCAMWNKRNPQMPIHCVDVESWCIIRQEEIEAASRDLEAAARLVA